MVLKHLSDDVFVLYFLFFVNEEVLANNLLFSYFLMENKFRAVKFLYGRWNHFKNKKNFRLI